MTQKPGQWIAQKGGCGQWFQMHLGKQEDVTKATGMCMGGLGAERGNTPAGGEVEDDLPGWVG